LKKTFRRKRCTLCPTLLRGKSIKSTEKYINIEHTIFQTAAPDQKWTVKVTADPNEIAQLIADGFEAHCNQGDLIFLRKRL
jgi:hypothetical protein